jgi:signal peptidase I
MMRLTWTAFLASLALCSCGPKPFVQKSSSMEPTIHVDEVIKAEMTAYQSAAPNQWDIVIFTPPGHASPASENPGIWIFRIVGTPGDTILFDDSGLFINGKSADLPPSLETIKYKGRTASGIPDRPHAPSYPFTIPKGHYFVLGDNPDYANDSRLWGTLPKESIVGKVLK